MITLDIISDPVCPWCYIGKTQLDRALAKAGRHPFEINWRPFQLNPDMPPEGADREEYLERKFGGPERAQRIYDRVAQAAAAAGLTIDFDAIPRTPNTVNAHRLIRWAGAEGRQHEVAGALFRRFFEAHEDISDPAVLADAAAEAGLDREMVATLLASDADAQEVRDEDAQARGIGIGGVPTFIIGGRYVVEGAQDETTWSRILEELERVAT